MIFFGIQRRVHMCVRVCKICKISTNFDAKRKHLTVFIFEIALVHEQDLWPVCLCKEAKTEKLRVVVNLRTLNYMQYHHYTKRVYLYSLGIFVIFKPEYVACISTWVQS